MIVADASQDELRRRLRAGRLQLDLGIARVALASSSAPLLDGLQRVYGAFPLEEPQPFCDVRVSIAPGRGLRRWFGRQARLVVDGAQAFEPFPAGNALALFEWGVNHCIAQRANRYLLLHAGVVARDGRAVVLAALPGSGKSTLTAALMLCGFRLLSDEFGVVRLDDLALLPLVKPVALKNASIEVIARDFPAARLGPRCPGTRKGTVAHLAPDAASVAARHLAASPALVVFPRFSAGSPTCVEAQPKSLAFRRLAFNSFNYALLGPAGFRAVTALVERTPACALTFGDAGDAAAALARRLAEAPGPVTP